MIRRILAIFKESPKSFEGQEPGEQVLMLLRKHPIVIYMKITLFSLALLIPLILLAIFQTEIAARGLWPLAVFVGSLWFMAFWLLIFYALTIYTLNVVIITDRRIMDSDQEGLFNRKVSELHISRIQDVSVHTKGMLETFFKYGDLIVQTAAAERQFIFHEIPYPDQAKDVIMRTIGSNHSGVKLP